MAPLKAARREAQAPAMPTNGHSPRPTPTHMVAAATTIRIDQAAEVKRTLALREEWQELAWEYVDAIGEVGQAVEFIGSALSKLLLYAAELPDESGDDPPPTTNRLAIESLDRLRGATGNHAEIMRELGVQLSAPGQCYLIGLAERIVEEKGIGGEPPTVTVRPERWFIASTDELKNESGVVSVEDPDTGAKVVLRGESQVGLGEEPDFWARIWRRSHRKSSKATSALRGVLSACEELLIIDRSFRGVARSRLAMAKILFVPDDISFGNTDPTTDEAGDGEATEDPFSEELLESFTTPIIDEGSAASVAPIILRGKRGEGGSPSGIEVISIDREPHELLAERAESCMRRIARGLNLPVEFVFGLGEANHWGAGQIEKQGRSQYVEPVAILAVDALTSSYHRATLVAGGMSPEEASRHLVWFRFPEDDDARRDAADEGHDRMLISDDSWRRARGFGEEDIPDEAEVARRIEHARALRPRGNLAERDASTLPVAAAAGPSLRVPDDLGLRLVEIDRSLATRLDTALDAALRDALRRVGNRVASRVRHDTRLAASLAQVSPERVVSTLGHERMATLAASTNEDPIDTIASVVGAVRDRFERWTAGAQRQALNLVPGMGTAERAVIEGQQRTDRADAWAWLREAMIELSIERLYDPNPEAEPDGEVDPNTSVPRSIVREAIARAGGAHRVGGPRVAASLGDRLSRFLVALGMATGGVMARIFRDHGVKTSGYEWAYGPAVRLHPYEPHLALNGVTFGDFDDPKLGGYAPGDHKGCLCDVVPALVPMVGLPTDED